MLHLKEIRLRNFRNYIDENIQFHPKINWIFGDNAQGKTNLVEAIYLLMKGISFRGNKEDWLKFQENHSISHRWQAQPRRQSKELQIKKTIFLRPASCPPSRKSS